MEAMDEEEKEALVEILVANSLPIRMMGRETGSNVDESRDFSTRRLDPPISLKYHYAMQRLIVDYFNYDSMQVTVSDLQRSVMTALVDLANDPRVCEECAGRRTSKQSERDREPPDPTLPVQQTVEDDGLVEVFSAKMDAIKRNWGETPSIEYTIWFPWQVHFGDDSPTFEIYGHTFESADQSEWRPRLKDIARGPDVRGGGYILDEIEEGNYDV